MSDYDRGAYAPHNEAPPEFESFDPRSRRARKPFPLTLIGSGVVLLAVVTALVMFVKGGSKAVEGVPHPVGVSVGAIKSAPSGDQPADPGAGLEVYSPQNVPSGNTMAAAPAPQFTPGPEQPVRRPAPPPVPVAAKAPTPAPAPAAAVAAAPPEAKPVPVAKTASEPALAKSEAAPTRAAEASPTVAKSKPAADEANDDEDVPAKPATTAAAKPHPATTATKTGVKPSADAALPVYAKTAPAKTGAPPVAASKPSAKKTAHSAVTDETVAAVGATSGGAITTTLKPGSAKAAAKTAAPKPAKVAAAKPAAASDDDDEDEAPAPKAAAKAALPKGTLSATKPVPASTAKGSFVVQVGAFPSAAAAEKGIGTAASKASGAAGKARHVETVQKDGKTLYRATMKGFGSKTDAAAFCAQLRAKGGQCIVRGAGG